MATKGQGVIRLPTETQDARASIGMRIRAIRLAQGISVRELAERLADGTHFTTIGKIETGKTRVTADRIEKFAAALGVSFAELANPNFAISQMRPVPVVKPGDWMKAGTLESAMTIGWIVSPYGGKNCAAFYTMEFMSALNRAVDGYSVVDLERRELEDGGVFMIDDGSVESLVIAVFKSEPARFLHFIGKPGEVLFLVGERSFTVVGRIIFEGRNL